MESSIAEAVLLPWWKIAIYIASLVLAVITIKVTITLDLNDWLKERKEASQAKRREKAAKKCKHFWTLYTHSHFSRCNNCLVLIATSTLQVARSLSNHKPLIAGVVQQMVIEPGVNELVTNDYIGVRD